MAETEPQLDLKDMAASLIVASGTDTLLNNLEDLLIRAKIVPARLYLYDGNARAYYAAAGFGCAQEAPDIPLPSVAMPLPENHYPLTRYDQPVGLLQVESANHSRKTALHLCAILGPALLSLHRQEQAKTELYEMREQMQQLNTAGELLHHLDLDVLLVKILESSLSAVQAQVGAILTVDGDQTLTPRVNWGLRDDHVDAIRFQDGRRLADAVFADGAVIRMSHQDIIEQLDLRQLRGNLTGLLVLPLQTGNRRHGVLLLANPQQTFGSKQQAFAETVSGMAAIALDNALLLKSTVDRERMQRELDLAKSVQESMYPVAGLEKGRFRISGASRPCGETGGDYYTYQQRGDKLVAMIGDVSGHGLAAAIYSTTAHAIIQQQWRGRTSIDDSFAVLNESLFHGNSGRFMTAAVVEIDAKAGTFTYVSAGHNPLLWLHGGQAQWLESSGVPLGIMLDADFPTSQPAELSTGDCLLLYTDGITEATSPKNEAFGEARLAELVQSLRKEGLGPDQMIARIFADIGRWSAGKPHTDDLTMVVITVS